MTFARTKIQPPRPRATFVDRGGLQRDLAAALAARRVVLVCAPAGYGKTMLLSHELARLPAGHALAWVSCDTGDDRQRLLECMLEALEPFDPPWRTAPEALTARVGRAADDEARSVAAEIINTLEACEVAHGVIVFDDLHRVDDPAFFRFLDHLVERMGERWTLVLSSREDPPLALARLRAADELAEFRQPRLQFARDEARRLAAAAGVDASIADRLHERTQGWPAGLRIAIGALRSDGRAGGSADEGERSAALEQALRAGERPLFEYLTAEVLGKLRPELAGFLLAVSVLPQLDASRCAQVSGEPNAAALLDEIERMGLFVEVLDAPARTLRLHDLFRDAMLQRLATQAPGRMAELRERAAATEPDPLRRIGLLIESGRLEQAAELVFEHVPALVATTGVASAERLLARFPAAFRERSPQLRFVSGLVDWFHWDFARMMVAMERAAAGFTAAGDEDRADFARAYRGKTLISLGFIDEAAAVLAAIERRPQPPATRAFACSLAIWLAIDTGGLDRVAGLVDEMVTRLDEVGKQALWYHTTPPHRVPGLPGVARPLARHAAHLLRVAGDEPAPLRALALFTQAWCALWQGSFGEARELRQRAIEDARWCGDPMVVRGHDLAFTSVLCTLAGDAQGAMQAMRVRVEMFSRGTEWSQYVVLAYAARIASAVSDGAAMRELLPRLEAIAARLPGGAREARTRSQLAVAAQLAWLEGRKAAAIALWEDALAHEEEIDFIGQGAQVRFRLARACAGRGDLASAARCMAPVFERVRAEGAPGAALMATDALQDLAALDWGAALPEARQAELRAWWGLVASEREATRASQVGASSRNGADERAGAPQGSELTAREIEVLRHIAAGDSNKLIARAMGLSLHTVKRHVANILGKLGATTRGQAAAWRREQMPGRP